MSDIQLLLLASELRTRAKEILVRATNTDGLAAHETMRVVAAGYKKLARQAEQRVREADRARPPTLPSRRSRVCGKSSLALPQLRRAVRARGANAATATAPQSTSSALTA